MGRVLHGPATGWSGQSPVSAVLAIGWAGYGLDTAWVATSRSWDMLATGMAVHEPTVGWDGHGPTVV
jgi:hypothetical protein